MNDTPQGEQPDQEPIGGFLDSEEGKEWLERIKNLENAARRERISEQILPPPLVQDDIHISSLGRLTPPMVPEGFTLQPIQLPHDFGTNEEARKRMEEWMREHPLPRIFVREFSEQMEKRLRKHDAKKGFEDWLTAEPLDLAEELRYHLSALDLALLESEDGEVQKECADIANFAMMVARVCAQRDKDHR